MKIGYTCEGKIDRCVIESLAREWCPEADIVSVRRRGRRLNKKNTKNDCIALQHKESPDIIILYTDSDMPIQRDSHRDVLRKIKSWIPDEFKHKVIGAVGHRNVECWLVADRDFASSRLHVSADELKDNPKHIIESYFSQWQKQEKENAINDYVRDANQSNWLKDASFEAFYDECKRFSNEFKCTSFPNLREKEEK